LIELASHRDGVLTRHRIRHQQHFVGLHGGLDRDQFPHQFVIDMEAATGIQHNKIKSLITASLDTGLTDSHDTCLRSPCLIEPMHIDSEIAS
jgi:hypothetical protein